MAIPDYIRQRFATLQQASDGRDLAVMECLDAADGVTPRYVLCAANRFADGSVEFVPLGEVSAAPDPYAAYIPPA
jgi:hypothetical protein